MFPPAVILLNPHNQLNAIALKHTQIGIKNSLGGNVCAAEVFTSVPEIERTLFYVPPVLANAHVSDDRNRELSDVFHLLLNKLLQFLNLFRNNIEE